MATTHDRGRWIRSYDCLLSVQDAHKLPVLRTLFLKLDVSVLLGEQRMVATQTNIGAGVKTGAALANDNVTCDDFLAPVDFDA